MGALVGLKRILQHRPRLARALTTQEVGRMCIVAEARSRRDAALLAVGFAAALRRSEIVALRVSDVEWLDGDRMRITIRQSKTDQAGQGQRVAVPNGHVVQPVARLRRWLADAGIERGPIFRSQFQNGALRPLRRLPSGKAGGVLHHSDVARLVKRYAKAIGIDPTDVTSHSLRAGFVTSAAVAGARIDRIMAVSRHKSAQMVTHYTRPASEWDDHAAEGVV